MQLDFILYCPPKSQPCSKQTGSYSHTLQIKNKQRFLTPQCTRLEEGRGKPPTCYLRSSRR